MVKAHATCSEDVNALPRSITNKDNDVKFDKKYSALFRKNKNYETVFGYNICLEQNLSKNSSKTKIKRDKQKLFKKYVEASKKFLRERLFQNPLIIKLENYKNLDMGNRVIIYDDALTDIFGVVDLKTNYLLDFDIATEVKFAEIFAFGSLDTVERQANYNS